MVFAVGGQDVDVALRCCFVMVDQDLGGVVLVIEADRNVIVGQLVVDIPCGCGRVIHHCLVGLGG